MAFGNKIENNRYFNQYTKHKVPHKNNTKTDNQFVPEVPQEDLDSSSVTEIQQSDWSTIYQERKRKSDEEKKKDLESQRSVRDKLALLAGGYLTGDGNKSEKYYKSTTKTVGTNTRAEVVVIDDDVEVIAVGSDSSNDEICQLQEDSKNDTLNQETNELKKVLHSNLPDNEKESILKKHGIRVKKPDTSSKNETDKNDLWLMDKVAEADRAMKGDKRKSECDVIILD